MDNNIKLGFYAEDIATRFLLTKNYEIMERNFRTKYGEIDIIAAANGYIIFVEVKCRKSFTKGRPCEAVTISKQRKIITNAHYYICSNQLSECDFRFDVIEVIGGSNNNGIDFTINHIENAFTL